MFTKPSKVTPFFCREFAGFSLDQIEEVTRIRQEKRKEQGRALRMDKKLQVNIFLLNMRQRDSMQRLQSREAREKWREEARRMIAEREERREEEGSPRPGTSPPFASDPDWNLAMCGLGEAVERQRLKRGEDETEVAKAVEMVEEELDREVKKAVEWAGRPGKEEEEGRSRRSGKIARLNNKIARLRRAISAPRL